MPFGFRKRRGDPRLEEWARLAQEFELAPAADLSEPLRHQFALGEGDIGPVYALERAGQPQLVAFDQRRERSGPTGSVLTLRTFVAVRLRADDGAPARGAGSRRRGRAEAPVENDVLDELGAPSLRASARRGKAFEAVEASRSGAQRLELDDDPPFDEGVSVFARDVAATRASLTRPVRQVLLRLLLAADAAALKATLSGTEPLAPGASAPSTVAPTVVVGRRNLLLCLEPRQALPVSALGALLADMLSLYAAFYAAHDRSHDQPREGADDREPDGELGGMRRRISEALLD